MSTAPGTPKAPIRLLSRDQILKAKDLDLYRDVQVPEWADGDDLTVRVKMLTAAERDHFETTLQVGKGKGQTVSTENIRAKLAACCMVDEHNQLLFPDPNDLTALAVKSAKAMDRVFTAAAELNGITKDDIEDLAGNSARGRPGTSSSPSISKN